MEPRHRAPPVTHTLKGAKLPPTFPDSKLHWLPHGWNAPLVSGLIPPTSVTSRGGRGAPAALPADLYCLMAPGRVSFVYLHQPFIPRRNPGP